MKRIHFQPALAAMLALVMLLAGAPLRAAGQAAEQQPSAQPPGDMATVWMMWPKDGQARQFEDALRSYAAWRKSAGETFQWRIYQPVVGDDLGYYVIRSGNHQWADFDRNQAWDKRVQAEARFNEKVGPYVQRMEHYFVKADTAHSRWTDSKDYRYYGVSSYRFKPGMHEQVKDAMDKVQKAATDQNWPYSYAISDRIGGKGGTLIVEPMKSYADMAEPKPSLMDLLGRSLGSQQMARDTMKRFDDAVASHHYTLYRYRPDLSTPGNDETASN